METKFVEKKKVIVISQLNQSQSIVQEIFVDESGNEIPHGENFVIQTSRLSDNPLSSWSAVKLDQYEKDFEKEKKSLIGKIEDQRRALNLEYDKIYHMTKSVQQMGSELSREWRTAFIRILDFMCGRINWVVFEERYNVPSIIPFDEFQDRYMFIHDRGIAGVKLLTIFGSAGCDGKPRGLNFKLCGYSDGSGSSKEVYVFNEEHEAIEKAKEWIESKKYITEDLIKVANKYGAELNREAYFKYIRDKKESCERDLAKARKDVEKFEALLNELHQPDQTQG
jgi:hypothetical protein